jgi:deoxyribodipyrimidine photolyase-related protein
MPSNADLFVVLGNQLFPFAHLKAHRDATFYMAEDVGLCTYTRHHKLKLVLFLAAMRSYRDELRSNDCTVHYSRLDRQFEKERKASYEQKLADYIDGLKSKSFDRLVMFEIEDKFFESRMEAFADDRGLQLKILPSPMFLTSRQDFAEYLDDADGKLFMADFYKWQRRRLNILTTKQGKPVGGKWSFDELNREKLPEMQPIPETPWADPLDHVEDVKAMVAEMFPDHPGEVENFWLPTTRRQSLAWLRKFFETRFKEFGPYEDALSNRDPVLFHSVVSPMINLGLITPEEIIDRAIEFAETSGGDVPMNSLEGFVRQIIGWREFIRGVYQHHSEQQEEANAWGHHRKMKPCWYDGTTGLPPLDDAIKKAVKLGWTHHIERLMVLGNCMNLCELEPKVVHDWFMEMFVDSSDWVMGPNVYGMGLVSDGGLFATKPYSAGSNYLKKMSDDTAFSNGEWTDIMDGLYWRFVDNQRDFFKGNARLAVMVGTFDRMKAERKEKILNAAERFIGEVTTD